MCQINAILKNIENAKAKLTVHDEMIKKENAQIQNDEQKDQNNTKHEDKIVYELNESIRYTEQQLQNVVSITFDRFSGQQIQ